MKIQCDMNKTDKLLSLCRKFTFSKNISYSFPKEVSFSSDYVRCLLDTHVSADYLLYLSRYPCLKQIIVCGHTYRKKLSSYFLYDKFCLSEIS